MNETKSLRDEAAIAYAHFMWGVMLHIEKETGQPFEDEMEEPKTDEEWLMFGEAARAFVYEFDDEASVEV